MSFYKCTLGAPLENFRFFPIFLTVSCFDFILFCRIFQLKIQIGFETGRSNLKLSDLVISLENLSSFLIIILRVFGVFIFLTGIKILLSENQNWDPYECSTNTEVQGATFARGQSKRNFCKRKLWSRKVKSPGDTGRGGIPGPSLS